MCNGPINALTLALMMKDTAQVHIYFKKIKDKLKWC